MKPKLKLQEIETLRHNARTVVRELGLLADAYHDIGITLAQRHLLMELQRANSLTATDITRQLLLEKSTVSRLVSKAIKKGFIDYIIDKQDKRRRSLQLTDKGQKALATIEPIAQRYVKEALLELSQEELQLVLQGMQLFAKGLTLARQKKEELHA